MTLDTIDHVEIAVQDLEKATTSFLKLGFRKISERIIKSRQLKSYLLHQGTALIVLSQSQDSKDFTSRFVQKHGEGICTIAFLCQDIFTLLECESFKEEIILSPPRSFYHLCREFHEVSIQGVADTRLQFISRKGRYFSEGFDSDILPQVNTSRPQLSIDHLNIMAEATDLNDFRHFYKNVLQLKEITIDKNKTDDSGSYFINSSETIKITLNHCPTQREQKGRFLLRNHGSGFERLSLSVTSLLDIFKNLPPSNDRIPQNYYSLLPTEYQNFIAGDSRYEKAGVLIEGQDKGFYFFREIEPFLGSLNIDFIERRDFMGFSNQSPETLLKATSNDNANAGIIRP